MITLCAWIAPKVCSAPIMLDDVGLPYRVKAIDLGKQQQFDTEFLKVSRTTRL